MDGHRLIAWAQLQGDADRLVARLFEAYFVEGRSIGDRDELGRIAGECNLSANDARAMLESDDFRDDVVKQCSRALGLGIHGVPFFIFDGKTAVSGAHDSALLLEAIAKTRGADPSE